MREAANSAGPAGAHPFNAQALQIYVISILFYTTAHMLLILLPLASHRLGATPSQIGVVVGAYMFTSMFLRPVAGRFVDRWGTRNLFLAALVIHLLILTLYPIQELWVFAILRMLQGVVLAFFSMVLHMMIIEVLPEESRGQGLALFSLSSMLPYTYGPFLAVYFADRVPMTHILLALIPLGALALLTGWRLRLPELRRAQAGAVPVQNDAEYRGWRDRRLLLPSLTMLFASAMIGTVAAFLPLHLAGKGMPYAGVYFFTETVVLILLRFFGRSWIPAGDSGFPVRFTAILLVLLTMGAGLLASAASLGSILLAAVCSGIALSMLYPTLLTHVTFVVPAKFRGRGIGLFIAAADLGTSGGTMVLGWAAELYSYEVMYTGCAVIGGAALLLVLAGARKSKEGIV